MVEAVGVDLILRVENTQVIDFSRRSKRRILQKSGFEVRNRYTGISLGIFREFLFPHSLSRSGLHQSAMVEHDQCFSAMIA